MLMETVDIRKQFAHHYTELDNSKIQPLFDEALPYYEQFIQEVTQFLERECSVTAFGKGDNK